MDSILLLVPVAILALFSLVALCWGVDSRTDFADDPRTPTHPTGMAS